jgi:nitroreductase
MTFKEKLSLLEGLKQKVSHPRLEEPAPTDEIMASCYDAAFRSPDHAWLRPWRFIECRGDERRILGEAIAESLSDREDLPSQKKEKLLKGPFRAPLVIICYANIIEHEKVPEIEQLITVGCAVNNLTLALYAEGFGAVWRTGEPAHSSNLHDKLKLSKRQKIIGFLYVGTPSASDKAVPILEKSSYVSSLTEHLN